MRPPTMTPSIAENARSENCSNDTGKPPCCRWRLPRYQAPGHPNRYMMPYQCTASGPIEKAIGLMLWKYGIDTRIRGECGNFSRFADAVGRFYAGTTRQMNPLR